MRKKIFVKAPCLSQSGYGEQSRFALRALKSREDLWEIFLQPIPWGQTSWIWEDTELRRWMDARILDTQLKLQQKSLQPDLSLQISIPNEFQKICPINIGYTAGIETDRVAPVWLQKGNEMNRVLVVSTHAKNTYINTELQVADPNTQIKRPYRMETPVDVVWEATPRGNPEQIENFDPPNDFNFLLCSQISPRKNFINTISWWVEEFIDQEVGLIVKTNIRGNSRMDREATYKTFQNILSKYPDRKCKVHLLHGDLSSGQMRYLYTHPKVKAMINIAHGEGFGLPLFEAAREALPIVTIGWSGQMDFLFDKSKAYFQKVDYTLQPVQPEAHWEGVIQPDSMWANADQGSYKMALRKTFKKWDKAKKTAQELQEINWARFNESYLYSNFNESILQTIKSTTGEDFGNDSLNIIDDEEVMNYE